jgi:hypothetical protein
MGYNAQRKSVAEPGALARGWCERFRHGPELSRRADDQTVLAETGRRPSVFSRRSPHAINCQRSDDSPATTCEHASTGIGVTLVSPQRRIMMRCATHLPGN